MRSLSTLLTVALSLSLLRAAEHPSILWLTSEDHGPHMGCYGDTYATTPNIDALAAQGMIFKHAWSCGPVCAAARTTIIAGIFAPSTGGQHMRSMVPMPAGKKMYPQFLREAGYYCTNNSKEDYNLAKPGSVWDESSRNAHWKNHKPGQPFFAIFNSTVSHESQLRKRPHQQIHDPAKVRVPAYHPDTPEVRQDWAQYYDTVTEVDAAAGRHLKELANAGLADDTIVFYYADHGSGLPRNKRWPCNSGLQMPMVVYYPPKWRHLAPKEYQPGAKSDRLVSFVDLAPTLLSLAGIQPPDWMQGHAFAGKYQEPPQPFIYGFRGRMDERYDLVRSVTDGRYVYLRNYMPHLSQGQHVSYQFETPTTRVWRRLFDEGKLNDAQSIFWRVPKAPEELYDLQSDRDEVKNLANSPAHQAILKKLRKAQQDLARKIRDVGFLPEGEIHSRSNGGSPYDMAREDGKYPFDRIFEMADLASMLQPDALPGLKRGMADSDSAVRYWAALGVLMRGQTGVKATKGELHAAIKDASPFVRIAAAQALGEYGNEADLKAALPVLAKAAPWGSNNVFVSMFALNAIGQLGDKARSLRDQLKSWPTSGPSPDGRYNSYVPRLLADLAVDFGVELPKPPAKARGKNRGKSSQ